MEEYQKKLGKKVELKTDEVLNIEYQPVSSTNISSLPSPSHLHAYSPQSKLVTKEDAIAFQRQKVVQEIIQTEKDYIRDLQTVVNVSTFILFYFYFIFIFILFYFILFIFCYIFI